MQITASCSSSYIFRRETHFDLVLWLAYPCHKCLLDFLRISLPDNDIGMETAALDNLSDCRDVALVELAVEIMRMLDGPRADQAAVDGGSLLDSCRFAVLLS